MTEQIKHQAEKLFGKPIKRYTASDIMMSQDGYKALPSADGTWVKLEDHENVVREKQKVIDHLTKRIAGLKRMNYGFLYSGTPKKMGDMFKQDRTITPENYKDRFQSTFETTPPQNLGRVHRQDEESIQSITQVVHLVVLHPGEVLYHKYLKGMQQEIDKLAHWIDFPVKELTRVCVGLEPVTPKLARKLSKFYNTTFAYWDNMQKTWDKQVGSR